MLRQRRQSGFTLIEATMAMVLLAIAAAGILLPFSAAAAAQTDAQRRVVATRLAADVIERIAAQDYGEISCPDVYTLTKEVLNGLGYPKPAYQDMSCEIQTELVPSFPGLMSVSVAVKYKQMTMATLKTLVGSGE